MSEKVPNTSRPITPSLFLFVPSPEKKHTYCRYSPTAASAHARRTSPRAKGVPGVLLVEGLPPHRGHDFPLHAFDVTLDGGLVAPKLVLAALVEKDPRADDEQGDGYGDGEVDPEIGGYDGIRV